MTVTAQTDRVSEACRALAGGGIRVSLFVDPEPVQLDAAAEVGAPVVELHTGAYADAAGTEQQRELERIITAAEYGRELGLTVHAGHGLHYENVAPIAAIADIAELNIGHAIVARAVFDGLDVAVAEMKRLMHEARQ